MSVCSVDSTRSIISNTNYRDTHLLIYQHTGTRGRDLIVLFERLDTEHRGSLDRRQFEHGIRSLVSLTPDELEDVWNAMDKDHNGRIDADEFVRFVGGTRAYSMSNQAYGGHDPFHHQGTRQKIASSRPSPPKTSPPPVGSSSPRQHVSNSSSRRMRSSHQGYPITENIARRIWEDAVRKLTSARVQSVPFRYFMVLITVVSRTVYPPEHPSMARSQSQDVRNTLKLLLQNHVRTVFLYYDSLIDMSKNNFFLQHQYNHSKI